MAGSSVRKQLQQLKSTVVIETRYNIRNGIVKQILKGFRNGQEEREDALHRKENACGFLVLYDTNSSPYSNRKAYLSKRAAQAFLHGNQNPQFLCSSTELSEALQERRIYSPYFREVTYEPQRLDYFWQFTKISVIGAGVRIECRLDNRNRSYRDEGKNYMEEQMQAQLLTFFYEAKQHVVETHSSIQVLLVQISSFYCC